MDSAVIAERGAKVEGRVSESDAGGKGSRGLLPYSSNWFGSILRMASASVYRLRDSRSKRRKARRKTLPRLGSARVWLPRSEPLPAVGKALLLERVSAALRVPAL